ncbi:DgyrCDS2539 [Dimorphilus gyrociliatus]|uniref:DgyrCDS2539 n=1 Tax=Dimorphilus gyrociliatus TaxID=2664684 RepID=A0A7I8VCK1_9ANNE|nr:DgyrCDS2539 [Dimorphilus gyrociliatus]
MRRRKYGSVMSLEPAVFSEQLKVADDELDFALLHRQEKWTNVQRIALSVLQRKPISGKDVFSAYENVVDSVVLKLTDLATCLDKVGPDASDAIKQMLLILHLSDRDMHS